MKKLNFRPMNKLLKLPTFLSILLSSHILYAGEITLKNGDVIHGELQSIQEDSITWSSDILGELKLPKDQISQLTSSSVLPFNALPAEIIPTTETVGAIANNHQNDDRITNCYFEIKEGVSAFCDSGKKTGLSLDNIVTIKAIPEPPPFKGDVKFGYNQKSGNTDSEELDVEISAQWIQQLFRHELALIAESDSAEGDMTEEKYTADYQLNYDFDEHWFSYGQAKYEKNRFSAIEEQYQIGAGLGHRLTLDNGLQVNAQLGATFLTTKRPSSDSEKGSNDKDIAGRWALKLDWPIPNSKITAFHHHELLWVADAVDDNQLESSTGIKIPLFSGIFSEIRYDFDHVSEPASEQKHADHEWVIFVGYNW